MTEEGRQMAEEAWLRSRKPFNMLCRMRSHALSPRKLCLFACAATCEELPLDSLSAECQAFLLQAREFFEDGETPPISITRPDGTEFNPDWQHEPIQYVLWSAPTGHDPSRAHLLRDIFGNPFRPISFSPEWRTSTAVAIAQGMYESRDFGPMPLLADALQDAGCEVPEIIDHCRGPGPHVRGCWVVDGVMGKS